MITTSHGVFSTMGESVTSGLDTIGVIGGSSGETTGVSVGTDGSSTTLFGTSTTGSLSIV